jgi:hypothetical protein
VTGEEAFTEALARALGRLYRIVLLDREGQLLASFGGFPEGRPVADPVPLPGGDRSIQIEIDHRSIEAADRALHDLADPSSESEGSLGAFSHLEEALPHLLAQGEAHIGRPVSEMTRAEKQLLVRYLDERGAFALRKAVESVAQTLGVSRFTVYNYLDGARGE